MINVSCRVETPFPIDIHQLVIHIFSVVSVSTP